MTFISNTGMYSPYHHDRTAVSEVTVNLDMYDCDYGCINYKTMLTAAYVVDRGYRASRDEPGEAASVEIKSIKAVDLFNDGRERWSTARVKALIWDSPDMMEVLENEALKVEGIEC